MKSNQVHSWGGDPLVYAVVPNWNCWPDTVRCVACLQRSRYANLTVLVVENGAEDGSAQRIRGVCPGVEIVETGANLGYAGGNARGWQRLRILYRLSRRALLNRPALQAMLRRDPGALARARAVADSMLRRFGASPVYSPGAHAPLEGAAS